MGAPGPSLVISPTPPRSPLDPGAPFRGLSSDSSIWDLVRPRAVSVVLSTSGLSDIHVAAARRVLDQLCNDRFARQVRLLSQGYWWKVLNPDGNQRYPSQSEADLGLMAMATFGAGANPRVMDAVMRLTGLYRPKWDEVHYANGMTYGEGTIATAIMTSKWVRQVASLAARCDVETDLAEFGRVLERAGAKAGDSKRETVFSETLLNHDAQRRLSPTDRHRAILALLAHPLSEPDAAGFTRVPVRNLARVLGVERKTVSRDLDRLNSEGRIDSFIGERKERWARLAQATMALLTTPDIRTGVLALDEQSGAAQGQTAPHSGIARDAA